MKAKAIWKTILLLSLSSLATLTSNVKICRATGSIYIRASGSVEPATAPISNVENILYIFTDDINDSLVIERDNIVVDGAFYMLQGTGSGIGIDLAGGSNVTIKNIRATEFHYGIYLYGSTDTIIFNNTLTSNEWDGIFLLNSDNNLIYGNTFLSNKRYGIALSESGNNRIIHNNFINNTEQTHLYESVNNVWNVEYPSGGNYWSDYNDLDLYSGLHQNETGNDGIGDVPRTVNIFNEDSYPFIAPISLFDVGTWNCEPCKVEIISNSTVSNFQLNTTQKTLSFTITSELDSGFCRITIPNIIIKNLWQNNYTLLVDGEKQLNIRNWTDTANTHIYFIYTCKTNQVTIIPEFPSTKILRSLIILLAITMVLIKRDLKSEERHKRILRAH